MSLMTLQRLQTWEAIESTTRFTSREFAPEVQG
jgi:hypothetical protein